MSSSAENLLASASLLLLSASCGPKPIHLYGGDPKPPGEVVFLAFEAADPFSNLNAPLVDRIDDRRGPFRRPGGEPFVNAFDHSPVGYHFFNDKWTSALHVEMLPGMHTISAGCFGPTDGLAGGFKSRMHVAFVAEAGQRYRLDCNQDGTVIELLLSDDTERHWMVVAKGLPGAIRGPKNLTICAEPEGTSAVVCAPADG